MLRVLQTPFVNSLFRNNSFHSRFYCFWALAAFNKQRNWISEYLKMHRVIVARPFALYFLFLYGRFWNGSQATVIILSACRVLLSSFLLKGLKTVLFLADVEKSFLVSILCHGCFLNVSNFLIDRKQRITWGNEQVQHVTIAVSKTCQV